MYKGSHAPLISKELFGKVQNILTGNSRPYSTKKGFCFNNLMVCGICGCKVLGEEKKKKSKNGTKNYTYYYCSFSKGRQNHNRREYLREEKLTEMFEEPIKKVTLNDEIAEWWKEGLREYNKNTFKLQENRLNALKSQYEKINSRLSKLYDDKLDGEISEELFKAKKNRCVA